MGLRSYSVVLSGTPKRLSDAYGVGAAGVSDAASDIPYRQILLQATGAGAFIGATSGVTTATGLPLIVGAEPTSFGPFGTGPVKLGDLWAVGAGATVQVLGVPF
jgi:hypothetical protein